MPATREVPRHWDNDEVIQRAINLYLKDGIDRSYPTGKVTINRNDEVIIRNKYGILSKYKVSKYGNLTKLPFNPAWEDEE